MHRNSCRQLQICKRDQRRSGLIVTIYRQNSQLNHSALIEERGWRVVSKYHLAALGCSDSDIHNVVMPEQGATGPTEAGHSTKRGNYRLPGGTMAQAPCANRPRPRPWSMLVQLAVNVVGLTLMIALAQLMSWYRKKSRPPAPAYGTWSGFLPAEQGIRRCKRFVLRGCVMRDPEPQFAFSMISIPRPI